LEREIGKVFRKLATRMVRSQKSGQLAITSKSIQKLLGVPRFQHTEPEDSGEVGISTGLGVTQTGGELLITEVELMPGSGRLSVTGQLGEVMKESAQIAFSYVRAKAYDFGILPSRLKKLDIHIHLPEGAIPKDGPSAGVTLVSSLVSALTNIPVRNDLAMTGEITLRGLVLQIGGLKEKLLAARRGKLKEVIIPRENEKDLDDVPDEILRDLKISPVQTLDEVIQIALSGHYTPLTRQQIEEEERRLEADKTPIPPAETGTPQGSVAPA
jgi:ATP-dependent Lon protease